MPKYRAFINVVNLHMYSHDSHQVESLGFYTNAFVEAESPEEAELAAVKTVRQSRKLRDAVGNPPDDPPRIFVEEIQEIADWPADTARPLTGFALDLRE